MGLLFLIAAFAPAAAEELAPSENGPHVLVLDNGASLEVEGPVERRDGLVIFRSKDGELASVRETQVVGILPRGTTGRADRLSGESGSRPAVAPEAVFTNDDLPPPLESWKTLEPPVAAGTEAQALPPLTYDTYLDSEGHGEQWWRDRRAHLTTELEEAQAEVDRAYEVFQNLKRAFGYIPPEEPPSGRLLQGLQDARRRLDDALSRRDAAQASLDALREEARRAGALPGWLR